MPILNYAGGRYFAIEDICLGKRIQLKNVCRLMEEALGNK
jgi:hypothetical protein